VELGTQGPPPARMEGVDRKSLYVQEETWRFDFDDLFTDMFWESV